jgi:hypothetical protein
MAQHRFGEVGAIHLLSFGRNCKLVFPYAIEENRENGFLMYMRPPLTVIDIIPGGGPPRPMITGLRHP